MISQSLGLPDSQRVIITNVKDVATHPQKYSLSFGAERKRAKVPRLPENKWGIRFMPDLSLELAGAEPLRQSMGATRRGRPSWPKFFSRRSLTCSRRCLALTGPWAACVVVI